ncbi:MAG: DoxX family protein [Bacteroidetes bacterium]|nr:DoxX family protein [Bacteroidota bacterium]
MTKTVLTTKISDTQLSLALLIIRVTVGVLMAYHGYGKLINFAEYEPKFMEFLGMSKNLSLGLVVFSEFFCSVFLILGLLTRLALIPLSITMLVAAFQAHGGQIFGEGEMAFLYLAIYVSLLLTGAGKYSADAFLFDK